MDGSVTVHMAEPAMQIWELVADVRNIGRFSPETSRLNGSAAPPARQSVRGSGDTCGATKSGPSTGRHAGSRTANRAESSGRRAGWRPALNHWHYRLTPSGDGTDVTESFRLADAAALRVYAALLGPLRRRRNVRDMRKTLERIKAVVETA